MQGFALNFETAFETINKNLNFNLNKLETIISQMKFL